jgi:hypothetical protein
LKFISLQEKKEYPPPFRICNVDFVNCQLLTQDGVCSKWKEKVGAAKNAERGLLYKSSWNICFTGPKFF